MNKKQAGIIVTLLALIVCAGILAAKVNGPLQVANDDFTNSGILSVDNTKDTGATSSDYFESTRTKREQSDNETLANFKVMMDDKSLDDATRKDAAQKFTEITSAQNHEQNIEQKLIGRGFEDVICYLEDDNHKARVVIKGKDLTEQQGKIIKDVVYSEAKIINVEVEMKQ